MLSFTYFVSICSLAPGIVSVGMLGFAVIFGILCTLWFCIARFGDCVVKKYCPHTFYSEENNYLLANDSIVAPQPVNFGGEKFNPDKHRKSFVEKETCSVCLEGFEADQLVTYWPKCKHLFHKECSDDWVKKNPTCPNCKREYIPKSQNGGINNLPQILEIPNWSSN